MTTIFCASKVSLLKRWHKALTSCETYIAKNKNELLEFLKNYNKPIVLIIESHLFEKDHGAFLEKLRDSFSLVKVCVLSNKPNIKEGQICIKLGVKGYGNSYMYKTHFQDMVKAVWNEAWWFYPDFKRRFFPNKKSTILEKPQATIEDISHLAIIRDEEEERIAQVGDTLNENEVIIAPYQDSHICLDIGSSDRIDIGGIDSFCFDCSVFVKNSFENEAILDTTLVNQILEMLGEKPTQNTLKYELEKGNHAVYQGNFKEYSISLSKKFNGFFIVKDKKSNRDGSDLIDKSIEFLVFKDLTKTFQDISQQAT